MLPLLSNVYYHVRRISVHAIIWMARLVSPLVNTIMRQIEETPGLPVPDPSESYWMKPPSPISRHNADPDVKVPTYADIVVIGSGITGTSFVRAILEQSRASGGTPPKIVMLEARDACSGATGR
jgi:hypothetical protein